MSLQMIMKIDGVDGESRSFSKKGWSEVISWNWGMTSNRKNAQDTEGEKTALNEISLVKPVGIDSPSIRKLFASGTIIPVVELSITPVAGKRDVQTKYVHLVMEQVKIKSIVTGGDTEDKFFKEHITLLFDKVNFEYSKVTQASGDTPSTNTDFNFCWDVPENLEWQQAEAPAEATG